MGSRPESGDVVTTVYETMRGMNGDVPLLDRHLQRLRRNCRATGLAVPQAVRDEVRATLRGGGGEGGGGGPPDVAIRVEWDGKRLAVSSRPLPDRAPLKVVTVSVVHPGYRIKTTDREAFESARREAQERGADEGLLLTRDGYVAEGTLFAIGWFEGDTLRVPSLDLGILPSVGRARVLEVAGEMGMRVEEGTFPRAALTGRPSFAVTATRGVFPIRTLDGVEVPQDSRTQKLEAAFWPVPRAS
jgi:branched-subunit amino acid aminotransferase/4-amino-4-deoxychorismate lyase